MRFDPSDEFLAWNEQVPWRELQDPQLSAPDCDLECVKGLKPAQISGFLDREKFWVCLHDEEQFPKRSRLAQEER